MRIRMIPGLILQCVPEVRVVTRDPGAVCAAAEAFDVTPVEGTCCGETDTYYGDGGLG